MFTGIVQAIGTLARLEGRGGDTRLTVAVGDLDMRDVQLGDSIAVSGACLTVVAFDGKQFAADVSVETLRLTTLGQAQPGTRVNLEKALTPTTRLGGHLVSGHVDGLGEIIARRSLARAEEFRVRVPAELKRYIAHKGSVCVDGISLTVNAVADDVFTLTLIPHTLTVTTAGDWRPGLAVNIEVDLLARYLERLLQAGQMTSTGAVSETLLRESGFMR